MILWRSTVELVYVTTIRVFDKLSFIILVRVACHVYKIDKVLSLEASALFKIELVLHELLLR